MSDSEDELTIGSRDFHKVIQGHTKEGYKEGISDGRETEFQSSFDKGFADGIRMGYAVGQQIAMKELKPEIDLVTTKLPCECCKSGIELDSTLDRICETNRRSAEELEWSVERAVKGN